MSQLNKITLASLHHGLLREPINECLRWYNIIHSVSTLIRCNYHFLFNITTEQTRSYVKVSTTDDHVLDTVSLSLTDSHGVL